MYRPTKPRLLNQPATIIVRSGIDDARNAIELICCTNRRRAANTVSCGMRGARDVVRALRRGIRKRGLEVSVVTSRCLGACNAGPNIRVAPSSSWVSGARVEDVPSILDMVEQLIAARGSASE